MEDECTSIIPYICNGNKVPYIPNGDVAVVGTAIVGTNVAG